MNSYQTCSCWFLCTHRSCPRSVDGRKNYFRVFSTCLGIRLFSLSSFWRLRRLFIIFYRFSFSKPAKVGVRPKKSAETPDSCSVDAPMGSVTRMVKSPLELGVCPHWLCERIFFALLSNNVKKRWKMPINFAWFVGKNPVVFELTMYIMTRALEQYYQSLSIDQWKVHTCDFGSKKQSYWKLPCHLHLYYKQWVKSREIPSDVTDPMSWVSRCAPASKPMCP